MMMTSSVPVQILASLSRLQDSLNEFIDLEWRAKRTPDDWGLAVTMECAELIDSYPWKWWKNVNAQPDFNNVRIELVDILHFSLSGMMQIAGMHREAFPTMPPLIGPPLIAPLSETKNAVSTFRNVIHLARHWKFEQITEIIIVAAGDLQFNLVGYYVAKHTLNYIRQLGGYKNGTYKKVKAGVEDNVLLSRCTELTNGAAACISDAQYEDAWNQIMVNVYSEFDVDAQDRRLVKDWMKGKK